jgi:hypothetical protein
MPPTSKAQRRLMAIAEHAPDQLYARNRGVLDMTHQQLHDFAAVKEKGMPHYVQTKQAKRARKRDQFFGE